MDSLPETNKLHLKKWIPDAPEVGIHVGWDGIEGWEVMESVMEGIINPSLKQTDLSHLKMDGKGSDAYFQGCLSC